MPWSTQKECCTRGSPQQLGHVSTSNLESQAAFSFCRIVGVNGNFIYTSENFTLWHAIHYIVEASHFDYDISSIPVSMCRWQRADRLIAAESPLVPKQTYWVLCHWLGVNPAKGDVQPLGWAVWSHGLCWKTVCELPDLGSVSTLLSGWEGDRLVEQTAEMKQEWPQEQEWKWDMHSLKGTSAANWAHAQHKYAYHAVHARV